MAKHPAWEKVKLARHPQRPTGKKLVQALFPDFIELSGDRLFRDDSAIVAGIATFHGMPVTVIAEEKGIGTEDKIQRNFGMPHPEGYRKARRLMMQAEKFNRPIITIIDTPGAYPGIGAEERGQAQAIAENLKTMMALRTPIIVIVLSEGGSGGALAIGVGDELLMFENAVYSIISPEGFASIVYKDSTRADEAAELMKLTAADLKKLKVIDHVIKEGPGLHVDPDIGFEHVRERLLDSLHKLDQVNPDKMLEKRYQKFRRMGVFEEEGDIHETQD
ncbi:MAG: acetyl-CoA carboxylase carboxyltransferase subunit alpha [Acholeplasmataceae bacterium]|nr:MAG: acetyl-CoA carboxylase carboxyltransferase subunit alpha [Acholeplasmataceae bacterium]